MTTTLTIRTDELTKQQAQAIADQLGLPLSSVLNAFLKQFVRDGGVNFSILPQHVAQRSQPTSTRHTPGHVSQRIDPNDPAIDWLGDRAGDYAGQVVETTVVTVE